MRVLAALPGGAQIDVGRVRLSDIESKTREVSEALWQKEPPQDIVELHSQDQNPGVSAYLMGKSLKSVQNRFKDGNKDAPVMIHEIDQKLKNFGKVSQGVGYAAIAACLGIAGTMFATAAGVDTGSLGAFVSANSGPIMAGFSMLASAFPVGLKMATSGLKKDRKFVDKMLQHVTLDRVQEQILLAQSQAKGQT